MMPSISGIYVAPISRSLAITHLDREKLPRGSSKVQRPEQLLVQATVGSRFIRHHIYEKSVRMELRVQELGPSNRIFQGMSQLGWRLGVDF